MYPKQLPQVINIRVEDSDIFKEISKNKSCEQKNCVSASYGMGLDVVLLTRPTMA